MNITRHLTSLLSFFLILSLTSCGSKTQEGPQMKVLVSDDGTVGRYVSEDETSYCGEIQDEYRVDKSKAHVELINAADGKGILTLKEPGTMPVFADPDTSSAVIGTMVHEEGYIPEVYRCLGYKNGWFKLEVNGQTGYVEEASAKWDAVDSF